MKKRFSLFVALLLLFAMIVPASAQSTSITLAPGSWTSSINIQNTGAGAAEVTLLFHNASGDVIYTDDTSIMGQNSIPVGGSRTLVLSTITALTPGQYSVVIESTQQLEVIANSTSSGPVTAGAYQGVKQDQLATTLYFPGLYKGYYNFNSEIVLQNTDTTNAASVRIEFFDQVSGAAIAGATLNNQAIPANSTRIFPLPNVAALPSGVAGLVSARVTSTGGQMLAGVANIWTPFKFGEFGNYNGFLAGSTTIYAPALYKNYYNFVSSLTIMNLGTVDTNVEVTYTNGTKETIATVKPFQAIQYFQPANANLPSGNATGVFSAEIASIGVGGNAAQPIVALVNVEDKNSGLFGSYNAPAAAGTKVGCPVVMQNYYGWFSAQTVQNVGDLPTSVKVTYASGQTVTFPNIPANGTQNIVEKVPGSVLPNTSSVSATFESVSSGGNPVQPLVVIVQENSLRYSSAPGDYLLAYTCVPQ